MMYNCCSRNSKCSYCSSSIYDSCGDGGVSNSKFVILGESPGPEELVNGVPFSGVKHNSAGLFLQNTMSQCQIGSIYDNFYVLNAINCDVNGKQQNDKMNAAIACRARLLNQLFAKERKIVLALGEVPLKILTDEDSSSMSYYRGWRTYQFPLTKQRFWVMHTYHPSHPKQILRDICAQDIKVFIRCYNNFIRRSPNSLPPTWSLSNVILKLMLLVNIEFKGGFFRSWP